LPFASRSLSIVIPAYNEERRLPPTLDRILSYAGTEQPSLAEVLVVNDGSTDATAAAARRYGDPVRVLDNPGNRGKGYSIRHGMLEARGSCSPTPTYPRLLKSSTSCLPPRTARAPRSPSARGRSTVP